MRNMKIEKLCIEKTLEERGAKLIKDTTSEKSGGIRIWKLDLDNGNSITVSIKFEKIRERINEKYVRKIKQKLKTIAKEFDLKYDPKYFNYLILPKKQLVMRLFISTCPNSIFRKYGKTNEEKLRNINRFFQSKDFKELIKKPGGCVITKKEFKEEFSLIKKIRNKKLKRGYEELYNKIKEKGVDLIVLIGRPETEKELKFSMKKILFHEWVHVLLLKNNIFFQKIDEKLWKLDEELTTYLTGLTEKVGFFSTLLKNINKPNERKNKILKFYIEQELKHREKQI